MDEIEFRRRAYENPFDEEADFLSAVESNPAYKNWLQNLQATDKQIAKIANDISIPEGLADRIKFRQRKEIHQKGPGIRQFLAIAASVIITIGVISSITLFNSRPTTEDLVFGEAVLQHLNSEAGFLESNLDVNFQRSNVVMAAVGAQFHNSEAINNLQVRFANDCVVIPLFESAHFVVDGKRGAITFIIINNEPVSTEFELDDPRFSGKVIPLKNGNLIIVGEKEESLDEIRTVLNENIEWVI